ncbi:hypothetical protein NHL50_09805 [Acidimicrobiia bacterium EGI L10123]|uniref:hypothetical protein n=1 Tax=Salinilacustrithrix flava TaxID=2957203 RepID=UPI003D7C30E3|nr:hypothetical protein [Acidimicrobiia bacterium EGI L10123]
MSDDNVNEQFEALTAGLRYTAQDPEAIEAVREALDGGRALSEERNKELQVRLGCSRATVCRIRDRIVAELEDEPEPENSFDSLERYGSDGFYFDEPMLVLYRILDCNQAELGRALAAAGYPRPSPATICRRLDDQTPRVVDGVRYGHKNRYRFQLTRRFESAAPYDLFQVDEFHIPVDVLVPLERGEKIYNDDGKRIDPVQPDGPGGRLFKVMQPRLLVLLDAYSRYVVSYAVLFKPAATMRDTLALFADAFVRREIDGRTIGGAPDMIGTDNGGALCGHLVSAFLELVACDLDIALGYSPQTPGKAKIEANGKPIKRRLTTGIVGRRTEARSRDGYDMAAVDPKLLLTADEFLTHAHGVMQEWNFEHVHSSTGEVPFERFTRDGVIGNAVPNEVLAIAFLQAQHVSYDRLSGDGRRRVDKEGVRLFDGTYHQAVGFHDEIGSTVEIRTLHHRRDYQMAFTLDGKFIDIVKHPSAWTEDDDRERKARAVDDTRTINRVHKAAANYTAAAASTTPEDLAAEAARLAMRNAEVDDAKAAKRDVTRPDDVGPRRRKNTKDAVDLEANDDTYDLTSAMAAMAEHENDDVVVDAEDTAVTEERA